MARDCLAAAVEGRMPKAASEAARLAVVRAAVEMPAAVADLVAPFRARRAEPLAATAARMGTSSAEAGRPARPDACIEAGSSRTGRYRFAER